MAKIIFTADHTLMSEYNKIIFLGFAACAPRFLPNWLYTKIFCPPVEEDKNKVKFAHCAQRKIEAALLENGFKKEDIAIVRPEKVNKAIDKDAKVLCITTHDPLGLGPASTTFSDLGGREPYTSYYFRKLVKDTVIKKNNLQVIVGGSGAWQLTDERIIASMGIDCVVVGEGEITAVKLIEMALNGDDLPLITRGEVVPLENIPSILNPTLNGLIEIARGCGRGCRFCNPTMLNYRCQPLDYILKEAEINVEAGRGIIYHSEDVLRYGSKNFVVDEEKLKKLFSEGKKLTHNVGMSHFALASLMSKPNVVEDLSEILEAGTKKYPFVSGQVGIETGSSKLVEKHMKGKVKPFKPQDWNDIVVESHKLMHENKWVPAETLIVGLPGETAEDVSKTLDLMDDLSEFKSIIVPLFFIPIGNLQGKDFFKSKHNLPEHWQLIAKCIRHNIRWAYRIIDDHPPVEMGFWKVWFLKRIIRYIENKTDSYLKIMEEGKNPIEQRRMEFNH
jgi:radical SAM superfamily enzyme YgiQ (UPF0313 family)